MIEQKIDELIASIDRLTQAVTNHTTAASADVIPFTRNADSVPLSEATKELIAGAAEPAPAAEAPKKTKGKKAPAAEKVESTPAAEAKVEPMEHPDLAPEEKKAEPEISIKDLRESAQRLVDAGHVLKIKAINTKFGIPKISSAAPEQFEAILAALNNELSALEGGV